MIKQVQHSFNFYRFGQLPVEHRKKASMYGLLLVIIALNLCLFLPAGIKNSAGEKMPAAIQLICFLLVGMINVWLLYNRKFIGRLIFLQLLFIATALAIFICSYFAGHNEVAMPVAASGAYLLPFVLFRGWKAFVAIPQKEYAFYRLPEHLALPGEQSLSTVNTMLVQICLSPKEKDKSRNSFPVTASAKQQLGKVFENFVITQNRLGQQPVIEIKDGNLQSFQWAFFQQKWWGLNNRLLSPAWSLLQNKLGPDAKIIIKRVKTQSSAPIQKL